MTIIFGSKEANDIRKADVANDITLEDFADELFNDMIYIEAESDNFDYDKIIDMLEQYENIENLPDDKDLFIEVMQDAQYFIKSLRDVVNKIENWQK